MGQRLVAIFQKSRDVGVRDGAVLKKQRSRSSIEPMYWTCDSAGEFCRFSDFTAQNSAQSFEFAVAASCKLFRL
ncbi:MULTISPECIES: hypothetical protein [unclassified Rhizobium]|uniref:hypothetical protein n=1 Tax=unclassified Rhizobium TaxID=2613769 RepID=UPI001C839AC9|nr:MULTISPECIES: hypothetical protein [unclassified Rhizobium]MBX5158298.1 hypothetical protein [Rhizobium sp. NZLR8]MBX5163609.1 hypothetical protein [Rhizobium sp. NZLR4b]MBX5189488.1 hypothetical protein [Rhizobium sp. NZLR3b]MBX5196167.1 hypothetical protein [Rhizobium sp. NZLR10]MBX5208698.1 hypothetical protein [Rhizobium sp. NZLR11]